MMENKKVILFVELFILSMVFLNIVSAEGVGISDYNVSYDSELIGQFFLSDWVHVTVDVKDFSNIIIDYKEDSVEVQTIKDNQRWDTYRNTSDSVLSTLSENEFQLKQKSEFGSFFSGNITKEGFEKLLKDERVKKIYAKKYIRESLHESASLINADDIWSSGYNGTGQTVCIIDSGVNYSHSDLKGGSALITSLLNSNLSSFLALKKTNLPPPSSKFTILAFSINSCCFSLSGKQPFSNSRIYSFKNSLGT